MRRNWTAALAAAALMMAAGAGTAQENWPQWRGPDQNNIAPSADPPVTWSESENILWKAALPSWSGSSPIVWGEKVFVMSPSKPEPGAGEQEKAGGDALLLLCLSKQDGGTLWEREVAVGNALFNKQNNTSPTPVTDGTHVWALTGSGVIAALDMDGNVVWRKNIPAQYGEFGLNFGYASSPVLYGGNVIIQVLHGYRTDAPSYLLALDGATGEERWRVERPTDAPKEAPDAYNTPTLLKGKDGDQLILSGGDCVTGHDPGTGAEKWRAYGLNPRNDEYNRIIATVAAADGMVFAPSRKKPLIAVRADGAGDVSATHVVWKWEQAGGPDVPTPLCDGRFFYMVDDRGVATCLEPKTGAVIWGPERTAPGTVSASPLLAGGRLYITNEDAVTTVMAAGPSFKILATNKLDGGNTLSSFAVSGDRLFLRTASHLYCIGAPGK